MLIRFAMPDDYTHGARYGTAITAFMAASAPRRCPRKSRNRPGRASTTPPSRCMRWSRKRMASWSGWCIISFIAARCLKNDTCYLQDLFTDGAARGGGVGTRADQGRLCAGAAGGLRARLLDDAADQCGGDGAVQQARRAHGFRRLPQAAAVSAMQIRIATARTSPISV